VRARGVVADSLFAQTEVRQPHVAAVVEKHLDVSEEVNEWADRSVLTNGNKGPQKCRNL